MAYRILVVDATDYRRTIVAILTNAGYEILAADSAFDAISKLRAYDVDLVVSEVELPGDNAFDLYEYIQKHYPYIPIIMTTEKNIDIFFNRIFEEGIGNVLCKPLRQEEFLRLSEKLITKKNIFGLENYMKDIIEMKKISLHSSIQIQKGIDIIIKQIEQWGFVIENRMILNLILNEMAINAVYHSHGFTTEKEKRLPVKLPHGSRVDLFFARSENSFGISINDYNGKLSKEKILESINSVIVQDRLLEKAAETGENVADKISETGRGIDLVRKLCGEYYFIIKRGVRTEIILLFDRESLDAEKSQSSLKIIEDVTE
ncbi:MAG: response regulator [Spirochaetes bacterium]|nr:response regulator [Spirochaetota bacterium]